MDLWPLAALPPSGWLWTIDGAYQSGGQPMVGPPQDADMSCGGWWSLTLDLKLMGIDSVGTYRAALVAALSSSPQMVVPCLDGLQPFPLPFGPGVMGPKRVPLPALTTFSSAALFDNNHVQAVLAAPAFMPAYPAPALAPTQAEITVTAGRRLRGREYFTLIGTSGMPRLHQIGRILATSGNTYTVSFLPALRENYAAGTQVAFDRPACTMKLDKKSLKAAWPKLGPGMTATTSIGLVETGNGPSS